MTTNNQEEFIVKKKILQNIGKSEPNIVNITANFFTQIYLRLFHS